MCVTEAELAAVAVAHVSGKIQTPLTVSPSGPMGGLIGLRVSRRDDEGCVVEMVPTTYDCTSTSPSQLYVPCELTPGASNDIQADITRIADAFRHRYKM